MHQGRINIDHQRIRRRGQPAGMPWPGRGSGLGTQGAGHGGKPVSEGLRLFFDAGHEPADCGVGGYVAEEVWCGTQLVEVGGLFPACSQ